MNKDDLSDRIDKFFNTMCSQDSVLSGAYGASALVSCIIGMIDRFA